MLRKIFLSLLVFVVFVSAQDETKRQTFTIKTKVPTTEVKSQDKTGTCWAFATTSFIESELLRLQKGNFDLSEMFIVRNAYKYKAEKYFRYHGEYNLNQGGQAHDCMDEFFTNGILPESVYSGKVNGEEKYNHREFSAVLKGIMNAVTSKKAEHNKLLYPELLESLYNIYLGEVPATFDYEGKTYTPKEFQESLGLNANDYVELTSYTNYPFYEAVDLEINDNYRHALYYNIPIDELMSIMDNSLNMGYTFAWDGSVDKKNFYSKKGYGVVAVEEDDEDKKSKEPEEEMTVTQEVRQRYFDNYEVNDDHLMHIVGIAENQNGTKFYYVKNSWGTKRGFDGYFYLSNTYMRLRTIAIMVHKDVIPEELKIKLGL